MAELVVKASTSSVGLYEAVTSSYADAHDAASGSVDSSATLIRVGQYYNSGGVLRWAVLRGTLLFDAPAAGLPDDAIISAAKISLFAGASRNTVPVAFNIVVVSGADLADPPVATDYGDLLDDIVSRGLIAVSSLVEQAYNDITLDATGISEISKTGITKFALRSSRDISSTAPVNANDQEEAIFYRPGLNGNEPLLTITYTGATLPIVTTQAVTNLVTTTGTGNGNITFLGNPAATQHGHCWNITGLPTISAPLVHTASGGRTENGAPSATGAFTSALTGLVAGNIYYIRAYATNTEGTSYGEQVTFVAGAPGGGDLAGVLAVVEDRIHYSDAYGVERWLKGTIV